MHTAERFFVIGRSLLLFTHTCPVTEFAVASHLNTANSCCHHVFLRHFRFPKCLPVNGNHDTLLGKWKPLWMIATTGVLCYTGHTIAVKMLLFT